jgi:hypothetical protein
MTHVPVNIKIVFFAYLTMSDKGNKVLRNVGNYLLQDLNILDCDAVVFV